MITLDATFFIINHFSRITTKYFLIFMYSVLNSSPNSVISSFLYLPSTAYPLQVCSGVDIADCEFECIGGGLCTALMFEI